MAMTLSEFLRETGKRESDLPKLLEGDEALRVVQQSGISLVCVREQTLEICLAAVKQNGSALQYIHDQTPELCLAAVKRNGLALMYVRDQTPEICLAAVEQNPYAICFVDVRVFAPEAV